MIFQGAMQRSTISPKIILEFYFHDSFLFKEKRKFSCLKKRVCEFLAHPLLVLMELLRDPAWTELLHFLHSGKSLAVLPVKGPALST